MGIGQNIQLADRVREVIDARSDFGHAVRIKTEEAFVTVTPNWETDNIQKGTATGLITSAIASATSTYVPILTDTEIVDTEPKSDGVLYTVNVDAGFRNQAMFRSIIESGNGYTSLLVDESNVESEALLRKRPLRDTYQFEVFVHEGKDLTEDNNNMQDREENSGNTGIGSGRLRPGIINN